MKKSLTVKQMRAADEYTIKERGVLSLTLMERAGEAICNETLATAERLGIDDVLIVCGGGNNGGDGFVAARLLTEKGMDVQVLCLAEKFSSDCAAEKARFTGEILGRIPRRRYKLIVDCIFGTGLSRAPAGKEAELIDFISSTAAYVISADIPSGLNGDNGIAPGKVVKADRTVTIGEYKNGLFLNDGIDLCGSVIRADIGIDVSKTENFVTFAEDGDIKKYFPSRRHNTHKGNYGKVSILAGSKAYSGAAILSAAAALRMGAGYTELCVPQGLFSVYAGKLPETILTCFSGEDEFLYNEADLEKILSSDCITLGMGCGVSIELYKIIRFLLENYTGKLVLDADGLNTLAKYGTEILKRKKCRTLLTPHIKEFSRLSGNTVSEILEDGVSLAGDFARKYGVVLLLKNAVSVLTDGERTCFNLRGDACLAKGGSGDTLAGAIGALAAGERTLFESALAGSYVTGKAAEFCAKEKGVYSVLASDVTIKLPQAILSITEDTDEQSRKQ